MDDIRLVADRAELPRDVGAEKGCNGTDSRSVGGVGDIRSRIHTEHGNAPLHIVAQQVPVVAADLHGERRCIQVALRHRSLDQLFGVADECIRDG